jgi:hypothetical protein
MELEGFHMTIYTSTHDCCYYYFISECEELISIYVVFNLLFRNLIVTAKYFQGQFLSNYSLFLI